MEPVFAGNDHVGLQQHTPQPDPLIMERRKDGMKDCSGDLLAAVNRMRSVHQYFRLDDRNKVLFLTEAAYRARAWALALMQAWLGRVLLILMTARHFAKRAPISRYSERRSRSPSRPSVIDQVYAIAHLGDRAARYNTIAGRPTFNSPVRIGLCPVMNAARPAVQDCWL